MSMMLYLYVVPGDRQHFFDLTLVKTRDSQASEGMAMIGQCTLCQHGQGIGSTMKVCSTTEWQRGQKNTGSKQKLPSRLQHRIVRLNYSIAEHTYSRVPRFCIHIPPPHHAVYPSAIISLDINPFQVNLPKSQQITLQCLLLPTVRTASRASSVPVRHPSPHVVPRPLGKLYMRLREASIQRPRRPFRWLSPFSHFPTFS